MPAYEPVETRFWKKVRKTETCWIWIAGVNAKGYGTMKPEGEYIPMLAHRFSWTLHCGEIPGGLCVLHKCDNPSCVRPDHLFLGTRADNNIDMHAKGRGGAGRTGPGSRRKLSDWEVREMCRRFQGNRAAKMASEHYGITYQYAWAILTGRARRRAYEN